MHLPATENKAHPTNNPIHGKYVQFISNYIFFLSRNKSTTP